MLKETTVAEGANWESNHDLQADAMLAELPLPTTAPTRGVTPIATVLQSATGVKVGQDRFSTLTVDFY